MLRRCGGVKVSLSISPAARRYQNSHYLKLRTVSMFAKGIIYPLLSCSVLTFNSWEQFENVLLTDRDVEGSKMFLNVVTCCRFGWYSCSTLNQLLQLNNWGTVYYSLQLLCLFSRHVWILDRRVKKATGFNNFDEILLRLFYQTQWVLNFRCSPQGFVQLKIPIVKISLKKRRKILFTLLQRSFQTQLPDVLFLSSI